MPTFTPAAAVDYTNPMATLTACHLVDPMCATPASLLGDATEHLYQLNHVYVTLPTKEASIKYHDRLFTRLDVWDATKKITVAFRSKAMLQLASLQNDQDKEYEQLLEKDELRHPLLVSLRLLLQSKPENREQEATATEHSQTQSDNKLSRFTKLLLQSTAQRQHQLWRGSRKLVAQAALQTTPFPAWRRRVWRVMAQALLQSTPLFSTPVMAEPLLQSTASELPAEESSYELVD